MSLRSADALFDRLDETGQFFTYVVKSVFLFLCALIGMAIANLVHLAVGSLIADLWPFVFGFVWTACYVLMFLCLLYLVPISIIHVFSSAIRQMLDFVDQRIPTPKRLQAGYVWTVNRALDLRTITRFRLANYSLRLIGTIGTVAAVFLLMFYYHVDVSVIMTLGVILAYFIFISGITLISLMAGVLGLRSTGVPPPKFP